MGEVIHAYDNELQRHVAIKFMRPTAAASVFARRRFHEEARILAQLHHPNVVDVFEKGEIDGQPFFVMAYLDGGTLAERKEEFRASAGRVVGVLAEVAGGVQHAHENGVYHRDLKASNIVFDSGRPVVTDFGCARWDDGEVSTQGFALLGTPSHMAPEVFERGSKGHDARADLWSLGVMLYHLLSGELPFTSDPRSPEGRAKLLRGELTPIRDCPSRVPGVDDTLEALVRRALDQNPNDRHQTAAEFAAELAAWRETPAEPPPVPAVPAEPTPPPALERASRRWIAVGVTGCILLIAAGIVATALWLKSPSRETPPTTPAGGKPSVAERLKKAGDSITFIGEAGVPVEHVGPLAGFKGFGSVQAGAGGVCILSATQQYFHEVFNEPLPFPVRWEVEVALGTRANPTRAGLYALEQSHSYPDGLGVHLGFVNDFGAGDRDPAERRRLLNHHVVASPAKFLPYDGEARGSNETMLVPLASVYPKKVGPADPWDPFDRPMFFHLLVIDCFPDRVTATRDGLGADYQPFVFKRDMWMVEKPLTGLEKLKLTRPTFGHGFGIYVRNGEAAFRTLRLTRLAE